MGRTSRSGMAEDVSSGSLGCGHPDCLPNVDRGFKTARLFRMRGFDFDLAGDEAVALVFRFGYVALNRALLHHCGNRRVNSFLDFSDATRNIEDILRNLFSSEFER